jgi:hypothetical protein
LSRAKGTWPTGQDRSVAAIGDQRAQVAFEHDPLALLAKDRDRRADLLALARCAASLRGDCTDEARDRQAPAGDRDLLALLDLDQQLRQAGLGCADGDFFHD